LSGSLHLNNLERKFGRNHTHVEMRIKHEIRILDDGFDGRHNRLNDKGVLRLRFERLPSKEQIPFWIYATSGAVGLILFALVVISLVKVSGTLLADLSIQMINSSSICFCDSDGIFQA
jgi:hypothetical protein